MRMRVCVWVGWCAIKMGTGITLCRGGGVRGSKGAIQHPGWAIRSLKSREKAQRVRAREAQARAAATWGRGSRFLCETIFHENLDFPFVSLQIKHSFHSWAAVGMRLLFIPPTPQPTPQP